MLVREMMTKDVITVSPDASLKTIGKIFKEKRISGAPVVDSNGDIVGVVTLTDLFRILDQIYEWKELEKKVKGLEIKVSEMYEEEKSKAKVTDIMAKNVFTVNEEESIENLMKLVFTRKIHTIPIVNSEGKLVGVIGKRDLLSIYF
jgi:predicted transcriptional regulator